MKIGGRKVIFNETFLVTKGEKAEFDIIVSGQKIPIEVTFSEDGEADPVSWTLKGNILSMTFTGWAKRGALMSSLLKPFKIGVVNGVTFGFNFSCTVSGSTYQVHFAVMAGGDYDE